MVRGRVSSVEGALIDWAVAQPLPDRRLPVELLSKEQKAAELQRMLDLHELYFGSTPPEELLDSSPDLDAELARRLATTGYASGDLRRDLYDWMGRENFEERCHDDRLDPVVLQHLRATTGV